MNTDSKKTLFRESKEIASNHNYTSLVSPEGISWTWPLTEWDMKIHTFTTFMLDQDLLQNEKKIVWGLKELSVIQKHQSSHLKVGNISKAASSCE